MGSKTFSKGEQVTLDKAQRIKMCIEYCKERDDYTNCRLHITIPKLVTEQDLNDSVTPIIHEVKEILERNKEDYMIVDSVAASFNPRRGFFETGIIPCAVELRHDFFETDIIPCAVELTGVYPLHWDANDIARIEELEQNGDIVIFVSYYED